MGSGIPTGYFNVEVETDGFIELVRCKSLASAKRWVTMNL